MYICVCEGVTESQIRDAVHSGAGTFELLKKELVPASDATLSLRSAPPVIGAPVDVDARLHVEMIRSGHIRWRLDGTPPKRGWIMMPEGESR